MFDPITRVIPLYVCPGMAQWDPSTCRLRQVIVSSQYRGQGVGSSLVRKVLEEARQEGRERVLVHALQESKQFYSKLGFTELGDPYLSGDKQITCQKMVTVLETRE